VQDHPGKLPVVVLEKTTPVTSQGKDAATGKAVSSTNYQPVWAISKWADRPPELIAGQPANEPKAEPVAQVKQTSQAKPDPATDEEEF
jgi:hypothetical protein